MSPTRVDSYSESLDLQIILCAIVGKITLPFSHQKIVDLEMKGKQGPVEDSRKAVSFSS